MSVCVTITSEGFLKRVETEHCQAYVMISSTEYDHLTTHQSVSAQEASAAIGFGFAVVFGLGYLTTYGVGVGKRLIGKA
ncbi:single-stranded DNA-binding protein [Vibrio sinaloensis]|uniref:single-stranded DNA-binding protein n=1 Tax=Photobacterium sp. (strain ATCC 43367) TaxID=379097 RepID=UPI0035EEB82E